MSPSPSQPLSADSPILCVGLTPCLQRTLTFAQLRVGEVNRVGSVVVTASGKGTNVARIVSRLGGRPLLTGFLGGDTGDAFLNHLASESWPLHFTKTSAPTRICQTLIDQSAGRVTELVEEALLPTEDEWRAFEDLTDKLIRNARAMVISGSPPPGAPADVYERMATQAAAVNCRVFIDAQKEPLRRALSARPFLAKLNREELGATLGRRIQSEAAICRGMAEMRQLGAENALVTQGAASVWLMGDGGTWVGFPPSIRAMNPIGSGDAMAAGLAVAVTRGMAWPEALRFGIACGAANALTETSGDLNPSGLAELIDRVRVEACES